MDRFVVFTGDDYYPSGGISDFDSSYTTEEDAKTYIKNILSKCYIDWAQLWDSTKPPHTYDKFYVTDFQQKDK